MKIIVDTNVLMSGIFWSGPPSRILEAWANGKLEFILSSDILQEYVRVGNILSIKHKGINLENIIDFLITRCPIYNIEPLPIQISPDKDDDKFIACAIYTKTKIIVSGDIDLLQISGFKGIEVLKPRKFIDDYLTK